jgi:hypothetical protein
VTIPPTIVLKGIDSGVIIKNSRGVIHSLSHRERVRVRESLIGTTYL